MTVVPISGRRLRVWGAAGAALAIAAVSAPRARASTPSLEDLGRLSVDELAQVEITSVAKRPEPLAGAPAAVFVITAEDIRRAGVMTLAEALRLAPNLQVQQVDALNYAISARGFNSTGAANKLLVLIDGRSVYTPMQSGVLWDAQTMTLDDVERIEVVSGPGGSLWGVNAVNGVINVVTRTAAQSQGARGSAAYGADEKSLHFGYGGSLGPATAFRVYAGLFDRGPFDAAGSGPAQGWHGARGGFRLDHQGGEDVFTLQGDLYDNWNDDRGRNWGQYVLARWARTGAGGGAWEVQGYFDRANRSVPGAFDGVDTYDLDVRRAGPSGNRHRLVVGGGVRLIHDRFEGAPGGFFLDPERRWFNLVNLLAQDEVTLGPDLTLTVGLRLENSSLGALEYLPNARIGWQVSSQHLLWAAVSRAARTPSRIERDLVSPGQFARSPDFRAEHVIAYEAGYRGQPAPNASLSVSVFLNDYDDLRTAEFSPSFLLNFANGLTGTVYGLESWGAYQVTPSWRLSAGLSALHKEIKLKPGRVDLFNGVGTTGNDPDFQASVRSQFDLARRLRLDLRVRGVDELKNPRVPGYVEADASLGWRLAQGVELALTAQNLLHDSHLENADADIPRRAPRSVYASLRWGF